MTTTTTTTNVFASLSKGYAEYKNSFRSAIQYIMYAKALETKSLVELPQKTSENKQRIAELRKANNAAKRVNEVKALATYICERLEINENSLKRKNAPILLDKVKQNQNLIDGNGVAVKFVKLPGGYKAMANYDKVRIVAPTTWLEQIYTAAMNVGGSYEQRVYQVTELTRCEQGAIVDNITGSVVFIEGDNECAASDATRADIDKLALVLHNANAVGKDARDEYLAHEMPKR